MNFFQSLPNHSFQYLFPDPNVTGFYGNSFIVYKFIYSALFKCILIYFFLLVPYFLIKNPKIAFNNAFKLLHRSCFYLFIAVILFINIIQIGQHMKFFSHILIQYGNSTCEERKNDVSEGLYKISQELSKGLKNHRLTGKLEINFVSSRYDQLRTIFFLSYYLYPTINIRSYNDKEDPDCLIFYNKKITDQIVPANYKIIKEIDKEIFLAIRKNYNGNL